MCRDLLVAWRSGNVCCSVCCTGNPVTFTRDGLQHHYRMVHKNIEFEEPKVEEGVNALRRLVASETLENLMTLSKNRSELVGKNFDIYYKPYY